MLHEDTGRARDVTQQVFEEVCKGITSYRGESSVKTWLLAITRNQCLKEIDTHVRRSAMLRDHVMQVESQVHTRHTQNQRRLSYPRWLSRLQAGLARLAPEDRSVLVMRFGIGVSSSFPPRRLRKSWGYPGLVPIARCTRRWRISRRIMHDETG